MPGITETLSLLHEGPGLDAAAAITATAHATTAESLSLFICHLVRSRLHRIPGGPIPSEAGVASVEYGGGQGVLVPASVVPVLCNSSAVFRHLDMSLVITYRLCPGVPTFVLKGLFKEPDVVPVPHEEVPLAYTSAFDHGLRRPELHVQLTVPWMVMVWFMCTTTKSS